MNSDVARLIQSFADVPKRRLLGKIIADYYGGQGIQMITYHGYYSDGVPREPAHDGFPEEWANRYIKEHLERVDPVLAYVAHTLAPVRWRDLQHLTTLSKANKEFLKDAAKSIPGDGIAFKVFGPNLRNAYVSLGFGTNDLDPGDAVVKNWQWVAQAGHLRFCEISDANEPTHRTLTLRELEVLSWIARGKSNSVIANLIGISPHTIDTHVRSIYDKLRVHDRTSAALRGQQMGLLTLPTWN